MAEPLILSALRAKRIDVKRAIKNYEKQLRQAHVDLAHVNAVLAMYENNDGSSKFLTHVGTAGMFQRREMINVCLAALQDSAEPMSTRELAHVAMIAKGLNADDMVLRTSLGPKVINTMRRQEKLGVVLRAGKVNGACLWQLSDQDDV